MVTELFPLRLAFRGLSDNPDGDEMDMDAPDEIEEEDGDEEEDEFLKDGAEDDDADGGEPLE